MRIVLLGMLLVSSACTGSNLTLEPPLVTARRAPVPLADHHLHLFSPASVALFTPPFLPEIKLPTDLAAIVSERWRRWNDQQRLSELYTPDALYYTEQPAAWVKGNEAAAGFVRRTISDTPYRYKPVAYNRNGSAASVVGYAVEDDGSDQIFGTFLLSLVRDERRYWRIAAENYIYRSSVKFETPRTAAQLVAEMDASSVQRGVVLSGAYYFDSVRPEPVPDAYAKVRAENDWTATQVAAFPDRLVAFCSFNALKEYALAELDRCAISGRFSGVKLHFNAAQLDFSSGSEVGKVRAVVQAANRRRLPLIVHVRPGNVYGRAEAETFLRQVLAGAPDVPIQIAHLWGGESYSAEALQVYADAISSGNPAAKNLYFDISGVAHYAPAEKMQEIAGFIRKIGTSRILFGSDAPIAATWEALRTRLPLTEDEFRVIAGNVAPYLR